jgi:glycosyltransferase involved in cell wall biosynthesis
MAERGLSESFTRVGLVENVWPYLAAMDVFLQTSDFEGLPLAVLEAMAAGLPVVATDVGGVGEAVRHGTTGYLSTTRAPLDLACDIGRLIDDPVRAGRMGSVGRTMVAENFGADRMAREIESIYRRVLDG